MQPIQSAYKGEGVFADGRCVVCVRERERERDVHTSVHLTNNLPVLKRKKKIYIYPHVAFSSDIVEGHKYE